MPSRVWVWVLLSSYLLIESTCHFCRIWHHSQFVKPHPIAQRCLDRSNLALDLIRIVDPFSISHTEEEKQRAYWIV